MLTVNGLRLQLIVFTSPTVPVRLMLLWRFAASQQDVSITEIEGGPEERGGDARGAAAWSVERQWVVTSTVVSASRGATFPAFRGYCQTGSPCAGRRRGLNPRR